MSRDSELPPATTSRKSTIGRPRMLTDEQVAEIMDWHDALRAWKAQRATIRTIRQLAKGMGVTHGAITYAIRRRGRFKRGSPEHSEESLRAQRGV